MYEETLENTDVNVYENELENTDVAEKQQEQLESVDISVTTDEIESSENIEGLTQNDSQTKEQLTLEDDLETDDTLDVIMDNSVQNKMVTIEVIAPDKVILNRQDVRIEEGDSVYSVLEKTLDENSIVLYTRGSKNNIYVEGIGDYFEFDYGPSSGFVYYIDGVSPNISSSKYILDGTENIVWAYEQ